MRYARLRLLSWLAALTWLAPHAAQAQDAYPVRPIRLIVGFAAGGSTDIPRLIPLTQVALHVVV
jgi:tripartite-type tricarboxylate transporter receptor subunit TctC